MIAAENITTGKGALNLRAIAATATPAIRWSKTISDLFVIAWTPTKAESKTIGIKVLIRWTRGLAKNDSGIA